jgi:hypothetical protein
MKNSRIARNDRGLVMVQGWAQKRVADFLKIQKMETGQSYGEIIETAVIHYYRDSIPMIGTRLSVLCASFEKKIETLSPPEKENMRVMNIHGNDSVNARKRNSEH